MNSNPTNENPGSQRKELLIERLEDRVLFDAVPGLPVDTQFELPQAETMDVYVSESLSNSTSDAASSRTEVLFIDKSVEAYQLLAADILANRPADVFFINSQTDGLNQMEAYLQDYSELDAIHIIAHGNDGQLQLGNGTINNQLDSTQVAQLENIGDALGENGDILIYGCNVASTELGTDFVSQISEITGADIAASDDVTGLGGDWVLENRVGQIESETLSSSNYGGTLLVTDNGFVVGTASFGGMNEIAVTPLSEGGVSSRLYQDAATANSGAINIDLRMTLIDTFDELGNVTTGLANQLPVTFSDFAGGPIILARNVGASVSGFQGHTAHILIEFLDGDDGSQLSVVGDFTFKDIDFIPNGAPDPGTGSEAVTAVSDQMQSYQISSNPTTSIVSEDNLDGTTTFTNYTTSGSEADQERWVSIRFLDMESLNLRFDARNGNTGYGLSTANFTSTPISFSQPIAMDDDLATDQNTSIAGNVVTVDNGNGIDFDSDGDPLDVYLINGLPGGVGNAVAGDSGGLFTIDTDGTLDFDPNSDFDYLAPGETATTSVQYTVRDYTGLASTATVTVTVTGTNDGPTPVGTIPNQTGVDGAAVTSLDTSLFFDDVDASQTLVFSDGGTLPPGLSIDPNSGLITGTLDNSVSQSGPFAVVISVSDGAGGTTTQTFIWAATNPGPTATNNSGSVNEEGPDETGNVITDNDGNGVDSDPDLDSLSVSAVAGGTVGAVTAGSYGDIVINSDGSYTYTLDNSDPAVDALDVGGILSESFLYTVSDGEGGTDTATLIITINGANDAPVVGGTIPSQSDQDAELVIPVDVSGYFSDPEGDTLTYSAAGLPTGLSIHPSSGLISGTLDNSASQNAPGGIHTITVTAQDDNGETVSTTFTWTVSNPGPVAIDDSGSTNQSTTVGGDVLSNDSDVDSDTINVNSVAGSTGNVGSIVAGSNGGQFTINSNGSYSFSPNGNFDGLAVGESAMTSVAYQITDMEGGTDTAMLTIVVNGTNDAPVATAIPIQSNVDSEAVTGFAVNGFFSDVDASDTLLFSASGLPSGLSIDPNSGLISGTIDSSASQGGVGGVYTVTVTANDGNGGTVNQNFQWTVTNVAPDAVDDLDGTDQNSSVSGDFLANDNDVDGDTIVVNSVAGLAGNIGVTIAGSNGGLFTVNADGSYSFDPNGEFDHLDIGAIVATQVSYEISDGEGGTSTAIIQITVSGLNDIPVVISAIPDQADADGDTISTVNVSPFFGDSDDGSILSYSAVNLPTGLSINSLTGEITGMIDNSASLSGPFTVTVTASDQFGAMVSQSFDWSVSNPGPSASNNLGSATEDSVLPATGNVITDDDGSGSDSDPDGDVLSVSAVEGSGLSVGIAVNGLHGDLTINSDGTYSYVLDNTDPVVDALDIGETLSDTFDYTVSDLQGGTATASLTITINGANDAPIVGATIPSQADDDSDIVSTLDVSGYFSDPDGDSLTYSAVGLPGGLSIDNLTGEITGTLDSSASQAAPGGIFAITVSAIDDQGQSVSQSFTWTVGNPGPDAQDDLFVTTEDTAVSGTVAGNDSDPDLDAVSFNQTSLPGNGSVSLNNNGSFTYTPDADFNGVDSFTYEIVDADGSIDTATVTITVGAVNDAPVVDTAIPNQSNADSDSVSLNVAGNFSDVDGDSLTFGATGLPLGLSIDTAGNITGTIDSSASQSGPYTIFVTADDGNGETVTNSFTWSVSNPGPIAQDDSFGTNEDTAFSNSVAGNDSDPDVDATTFSQLSSPSDGTLSFNNDGTFTYTPDADFHGTDSFDYEIVDADGSTSTATVTIVIASVNDAPVVGTTIPNQSSQDSDSIALNVASNFSDVDGDALTFSATGLPLGLSIDTAGNITGTIDSSASQSGPYTIFVTADDGNGETVTNSFTWSVSNPGPIAQDDSFGTNEDTAFSNSVAGNDSDPDVDATTFSQLTSPSDGTLSFNNDGTFTYTPDAGFNGTDGFDYQIVDADGSIDTATVTITVGAVNDAPVVDTAIPDQSSSDSDSISLNVAASFSDVDGDTLTFSATGLPLGLSIDTAGNITGTIDSSASQTGPFSVFVTADDGNGETVTDSFTWTVGNPGPDAQDDLFVTTEDTAFSGTVAGNDSDPDLDAVSFNQTSLPGNGSVSLNNNGSFTYTPDADFNGVDSFTYEIVDADGSIDTATVTITVGAVNDAPVVDTAIPNQSNADSDSVSLNVAGNFSDVDGDSLTFGATGLPLGLSIDTAGNITGTIDSSASQSGPYTIFVTADDGNGETVTNSFTWSVSNPGPIAQDDSFGTNEDTAFSNSVAGNDSDPDVDATTFNQLSSPSDGTLSFNNDGTFTYTPDADFHGTDSFDYEIVDADGSTSTATVTIVIASVNDAPVVGTTIPNQSSQDSDSIALNVASNFSDVDGDALTFSATGLPLGLSIDTAGNITGTIDSSASQSGPYTIFVTADDGNGETVTNSFTWSVSNPGPIAQDDSFGTNEDTAFSNSVAGNDSDPDVDATTFSQLTSPSDGTLSFNNDGTFTYTPDADFHGTDSFDYEIVDADGSTSIATVTIVIASVNDAPVVGITIPNQSSQDSDSIALNVASNFSDVDGDALTFSATGLPHGLSIDTAGNITGTIDSSASQSGPYTIFVTADDGNGETVTNSFNWSVSNPGPIAQDDLFGTTEDTALSGTVAGNDSDPDLDTVSFNQTSLPSNGSLTLNSNGSFTYTPDADFNGVDSFTYEIIDVDGSIDTATVTITVGAVNDAPVVDTVVPDQSSLDSDTVSLDISGNFSDVEGDTLAFTATGLPTGLSIDASGNITGTIDNSASLTGTFAVSITAIDGNGGVVTHSFDWSVSNPGPTAFANSGAVIEDVQATESGNVIADHDGIGVDSDPDSDALLVAAVDGINANVGVTVTSTFGTIQINADGAYVYTLDVTNPLVQALDVGETLTESFDYMIDDEEGGTDVATLTITINGTNDAPTSTTIPNQSNQDADSPSLSVAGFFADVESDTLTFAASGLPGGLSINPSTGLITGLIDGNASQGGLAADGVYSVQVTATDDNGDNVTSTFVWTIANPVPVAGDDSYSTNEDTVLTDSVVANDFDADNDVLAYSLTTAPGNGALTFNPDGSFVYTPDADFNGVDTFTYELCDADGDCTTASVTINVAPINDAPTVTSIPDQSSSDNDLESFDLTLFFGDIDADSLTYTVTGLPTGLSASPSGIISGTIDSSASQSGPFTVTVSVDDGNGGIVVETFDWTVDNIAPQAVNDSFSTSEDTILLDTVATNDSDPDGDATTFTLTGSGPSNGTISWSSNGSFVYTPDPGFNGYDSFDYMIVDADGATAIGTANISIGAVNDLPFVVTPVVDQVNLDSDTVSVDVSGNFADPDGDTLNYSATGLPPGLSIDPATGMITGSIDNNASQLGPFTVVISVDDGSGTPISDSFVWHISNPAPDAQDDGFTTDEDTALTASVVANDSDPDGDATSFNLMTLPTNGTVVFNADGSFEYTPATDFFGIDTFDYEIVDADSASSFATVTINVDSVNDQPIAISPIPNMSNLDADIINVDVGSSIVDPEGSSLVFTANNLPPGLTLDPVTGFISGTIDTSASVGGPYAVEVIANDGAGGTFGQFFTWNIDNPAPIANNDSFTTNEDTVVSGTVVGNDTDPDGDSIAVAVTSGPANGDITLNPDGTFSYTPDGDFNGTDSFEYQLTDADGKVSSATVTIDVTPVNDAPIVKLVIGDQVNNDSDLVSVDLSGNFDDVDDSLMYSAANLPTGLSIDLTTGIVTGTIDSSASTVGPFTVFVTATDTNGESVSQSFTWSVNNPDPTAVDDSFTTTEDTPLSGVIGTNDSDPDGDAMDFVLLSGPSNGLLNFNSDGTFDYTPNADFHGTDTFEYMVTDADGSFSIATATIEVTSVNDAPIADDEAASIGEDATLVINLLDGDVDLDGDVIKIVAINGQPVVPGDVIDLPSGATVTVNIDGTVIYDTSNSFEPLETGETAIDTFEYTIADPFGATDVGEAVVSIAGSTPTPHALDDYAQTPVDTPIEVPVVDNDYLPNGDPVGIVLLNDPVGGDATATVDGNIKFIPDAGFEGIVTIHYLVEDGTGQTTDATLTIEVVPAFAFDSFTNLSNTHDGLFNVDVNEGTGRNVLSQKIMTLAPEPLFSGYARPGTIIIGRIYDESGALIGESNSMTDAGGNWMLQFQGVNANQTHRIEFEQQSSSAGLDVYGYFGLESGDNSYQAMEPLTTYERPISVENAINSASGKQLDRAHQQNESPNGFGR